MYFVYVVNWLYRILKIPFPLVTGPNSFGLVSIFDLFMFSVFVGVFIILIKYLVTDQLDIKIGNSDINYSSNSYIGKKIKSSKKVKSENNSSDKE